MCLFVCLFASLIDFESESHTLAMYVLGYAMLTTLTLNHWDLTALSNQAMDLIFVLPFLVLCYQIKNVVTQ